MHFSEYQLKAAQTAIYPRQGTQDGLEYCIFGLMSEAGELCGHYSKCIRDKNKVLDDEMKKLILKETGDCMWFLAQIATELKMSLEQVAEINLKKLNDRKERGVLGGYGDSR